VAIHGNRFGARGKGRVDATPLVREGVDFLASQRVESREPEGLQDLSRDSNNRLLGTSQGAQGRQADRHAATVAA